MEENISLQYNRTVDSITLRSSTLLAVQLSEHKIKIIDAWKKKEYTMCKGARSLLVCHKSCP